MDSIAAASIEQVIGERKKDIAIRNNYAEVRLDFWKAPVLCASLNVLSG